MLEHVIRRVEKAKRSTDVAVVTSTETSDDAIVDYCRLNRVSCFRGPLENVAQRFALALTHFDWDACVRISGDSPLLDPALIDQAVEQYVQFDFDLVTNVRPRSYPRGQSVELIDSRVLRENVGQLIDPIDYENVMPWFYRRLSPCQIGTYSVAGEWSDTPMTVDVPEDLTRLQRLYDHLGDGMFDLGWRELAIQMRQLGLALPVTQTSPSFLVEASGETHQGGILPLTPAEPKQ